MGDTDDGFESELNTPRRPNLDKKVDNNGETNRTSISKLITSTPRNVPVMHHSPDASPIKTSSDIHVPFDQCDRNSSYGDSKSFKKLELALKLNQLQFEKIQLIEDNKLLKAKLVELPELQSNILVLNVEIERLNRENDDLKRKVKHYEIYFEQLSDKQSVLNYKSKYEKAVQAVEFSHNISVEMQVTNAEIECLNAANKTLKQEIECLSYENSSLKQKLEHIDKTDTILKQKIKCLSEENDSLKQKMEHFDRMDDTLKQYVERLTVENEAIKQQIENIYGANKEMKQEISDLNAAKDLPSAVKEKDEVMEKLKNTEKEFLKMATELNNKNEICEKITFQLKQVKAESLAHQKANTEFQEMRNSLHQKIEQLNAENSAFKNEISELVRINNENKASMEILLGTNNEFCKDKDKLVLKIMELQDSKEAMIAEKNKFVVRINQLEKELDELRMKTEAVVRERDLQTESAVKNQKELISLQDSVKKLESLAENRLKELKKCENLVKDLAAERYALDKERDKVRELQKVVEGERANAKRYRDEAVYLRNKNNEKKIYFPSSTSEYDILLRENEHLKVDVEVLARKCDDANSQLDRMKTEFDQIQRMLDEKREQFNSLENELIDLKRKHNDLLIICENLERMNKLFQVETKRCYREIKYLNEKLSEKNEVQHIECSHGSVTDYESGQIKFSPTVADNSGSRSEFDSRFSSVQFINVSLWDFVPVEIRNKLSQLKESNQQVRDLIDYLIGCNVTTVSETAIQISENIGKSALCQSILLSVDRAKSMLESISSDETLSEIELNRKKSGSLLCTSQACHSLNILHRCIINVEMHGKLTPNIKQLLIKLLSDVERCDNSAEKIDIAVNNFFANLDLALKKTLSILEEYQKKYEEMKERYNVISSELNDARESDYKSKAMIANLCSHLEAEVKKRTQLENYLEQSNEKNRILENDIKDQKLEIDEMQISLNVKKSLIANAKNYIEEWEKSFDEINQKRRDTNHENEELKRLLSGKERELIQLEAKCYTAINETTKKEREMRYLEGKFIRSKVIIKILRRKYEKRENFLIEMESILKATKIKLDCTREIKRMLQEMVDRLKRFLAEHGCNIDEIAQLRNSDPILSSSAFGPINLSTVDSFKVETLYCKLSKKSKKIENLEQRLEQSKENFYIPDWRKESDDEIKIDDEDCLSSYSRKILLSL